MEALKGKKKKIDFISNNDLVLKYHCENTQKDDLKCCCGDKLGINSDVYLFVSSPKSNGYREEIWAGSACGKQLIALSNEYNGTTYKNPPLLKTGGLQTSDEIIHMIERRCDNKKDNPERASYTKLNIELMIGVYILACWKWKYPVPDRLFGKILSMIYESPNININENYINRFKKASGNENFNVLLQKYRIECPKAFPNFEFRII